MSDILCVVCGEPWDSYGVRHGDMAKWEADLFRKGAGCPACHGVPPASGQWEPRSIFDLENGDEDESERIYAHENFANGKAPKWEKPKAKIFWTCAACGVQVREDIETGKPEWHVPRWDSIAGRKYPQRGYHDTDIPPEKPEIEFEGETYCEDCCHKCANCDAIIVEHVDFSDCYDPGWNAPAPEDYSRHPDLFCIDCYSSLCEHCHQLPEDCDCYCECGSGDLKEECDCRYCDECGELKDECECVRDDDDRCARCGRDFEDCICNGRRTDDAE